MIPKTTQPLTKMIRTLEGQLVVAANIALVAIPIITDSLSANQAVRYGVILNGATVIARSALKAIAAIKTPQQQPVLAPDVLTPEQAADPLQRGRLVANDG